MPLPDEFPAGRTTRALLTLMVMLMLAAPAHPQSRPDWLTVDEKLWLERHPVIRVGPAPNYPPIEFFDEAGQYRGLAADYLKVLADTLGVRFEVRRLESWRDVVEATQAGEIDLWPEAVNTASRRLYMRFTRPYIVLPSLIITRKDAGLLVPEDLSGMRVTGVLNYASTKDFMRRYPHIPITRETSLERAMQKLAWGETDAVIAASGPAVYIQQKLGLTNLHVAGQTGFQIALSMAVRKDWPELATILDKALQHLPQTTHQSLRQRWIRLEAASWQPGTSLLMTGLLVLAIALIAGIVAWNRSLRRLVRTHARTLAERKHEQHHYKARIQQLQQRLDTVLNLSSQPLLLTDLQGHILQVNQPALQLLELTHEDLVDFKELTTLVSPGQNVANLVEQWQRVVAAGEGTLKLVVRAQLSMKDHEIDARIRVLPDANPPTVWVAVTDKTGRAEHVRARAAEFRHVYRVATEMISRLTEGQDALHKALMDPSVGDDPAALVASQQRDLQLLQQLVEDACSAGLYHYQPPVPHLQPVALSTLMSEIEGELELMAQRAGVQLNPLPLPPGLSLHADRRHCRQALIYLFRIATCQANTDSTITVSAQQMDQYVTLAISYHGRPVPEPDTVQVLSEKLASQPGLTGYELYLAQQYLHSQSGKLIIDSAGELSTILHIRLPAADTTNKPVHTDTGPVA